LKRSRGFESLAGGTFGVTGRVDLVSVVRLQFGQLKKCAMVVGVSETRSERYHLISTRHFGQTGGSKFSRDCLSESTMLLASPRVRPLRMSLQHFRTSGRNGKDAWATPGLTLKTKEAAK
jgi:hypothetical protein